MEEFNKMVTYMKCDFKIKKLMFDMSFNEFDNNNLVSYNDKIFNNLKDIKYYFNKMLSIYGSIDDIQYLDKIFSVYFDKLVLCSGSENKYKIFYEECVSSLSNEVIDLVGTKCIGYSLNMPLSISFGKSMNEILHIMHQRIINNEYIIQKMPVVDKKILDNGEDVILYGFNSNMGNLIYNSINGDIEVGCIDILSLNEDDVIMMIRNRGHALSVEVEREGTKVYVRYHIPKICNYEMAKRIRGISNLKENSKYANGIFETTIDKLGDDMKNFILSVPDDSDMLLYDSFFEDVYSVKHR